jgi:hypothetical protein
MHYAVAGFFGKFFLFTAAAEKRSNPPRNAAFL